MNNCAIILATANNKIKNSKKTKAMCEVLCKPMLGWVLSAVKCAAIDDVCIVTDSDDVKDYFAGSNIYLCDSTVNTADFINRHSDGNVIVIDGCMPFADGETLVSAMNEHAANNNDVTVITADGEVHSAVYAHIFKAECVTFEIDSLKGKTGVYKTENQRFFMTAGTGKELNRINELARHGIIEKMLDSGVDIPCADGIIIGPDCKIGCDTTILPGTVICGDVTIGEDCVIGPNSYVYNAEIGNGVAFNNGQIRNAKIMNDAAIGPFVQIRPDSVIKDGVHLGNFVEVKNSTIGESTSVSHLTYVGDSDVGSGVNFGCGVVTVNFNGKTKNRTVIKDRAFIGCNTNLVAPVTVGENSYTAAGSTITHDVPDNTLAIARERQTNKEGWVKEHQPYRKKV